MGVLHHKPFIVFFQSSQAAFKQDRKQFTLIILIVCFDVKIKTFVLKKNNITIPNTSLCESLIVPVCSNTVMD